MNRITKRTLSVSLVVLAGAAFLTNCGPENIDNQAYEGVMINAQDTKPQASEEDEGQAPQGEQAAARPMMRGAAPAAVGAPVAVAAPTPVVQLPPQFVRLPGEVTAQPPTESFSGENREIQQDVLIQKDIFIDQPHRHGHNIHTNLTVNRKFHKTIHLRPSLINYTTVSNSAAETAEVLPDTVVTAPTAVIAAPPVLLPGCARFFSGGFNRFCGPVSRAFPVVGPYFR